MATSASPPDNPLSPILTGGWQCGAVGYALLALPERVHICHCRMCQKAVGGPFASWAPVRGSHLTWKRGTVTTFASSSSTRRGFCGKCGTPLTFQYIDSDWIAVTIGSLGRPQDIPPTLSFGIESRLGWLDEIDFTPWLYHRIRNVVRAETQIRELPASQPRQDARLDFAGFKKLVTALVR
jgi:hypothetical protein